MSEQKNQVDDLFGEELFEPGGSTPAPGKEPSGEGPSKWWLILVAVLVLGVGWYLSDRQHNRYFLVVNGGVVHVERGYFFPFGSGSWSESRAYEPFQIPAGIQVQSSGALSAQSLDQKLLKIYIEIATQEVADLEHGRPELAEAIQLSEQKLRTTTVADNRLVLRLLGDVAFRRGISEFKGIQSRLEQARSHFETAAMRGGKHARWAREWAQSIDRLRQEIRDLSVRSGLDPDLILEKRPPSVANIEAPAGVPDVTNPRVIPNKPEAAPEKAQTPPEAKAPTDEEVAP